MAAIDTITLDNIAEKLPLWRPDDENHLYAVVDMGSNAIRFSITSLEPPRSRLMPPVYSARAPISLFDALTPSPEGDGLFFPESVVDKVAAAVSRFHHLAVLHSVAPSQIMVLATEAMRRAANASAILDAIAKATGGLSVHLLDPPVETLLGAVMGSKSGLGDIPAGALFLDLGGGSVQMTWVDTRDPDYPIKAARAGKSLPYGAAKLIRILEERPEAEAHEVRTSLADGFRDLYAQLCSCFPALAAIKAAYDGGDESRVVDVYMCGGGFRGYGSMLMHNDPIQPYPIPTSTAYSVPGPRFKQTAHMLCVHQSYEGKIFELSKRRRKQFPAIVAVVDAFIHAVPNIGWVTFCGGSNRQGALMMRLPLEVRESNPLEVLAGVAGGERPVFDAILRQLRSSLPPDVDLSKIPSIFSLGLGSLFVREAWGRHGHDAESNSAFAVHRAISRDTDSPGLTHIARAALGVGIAARWGGNLGPADAQLYKGLRAILEARDPDAPFWVQYLGGVAGVLAFLFPVMPMQDLEIARDVRFHSHLEQKDGKRGKIVLNISLAAQRAKGINLEDLADRIDSIAKNDDQKPLHKILVHIDIQSQQ
ncbi:Retrograde regulation protein 2 [Escovopsis weberi]|uniref:Retrograde regulation protein 2 n=1 Tax=Escovopsis weberi TaxID=150374 RepID=A0A0M8MZK8_ESCWE|nr:Retrograde regulation protein 2 [Escovopsis weberi]